MQIRSLFENYYWEFRYRYRKWIWDRASRNSIINGVALMYHHVTDEYVDTNDSCRCTVSEFKNAILQTKEDGRCFVSVDKMLDIIKTKSREMFAVLTFDDVPNNFYTNAYPFLKQENIPFILFITTDFINKVGFLTKEQLLELDKDPLCTIGAHTISHPMLRNVTNSMYELCESKSILEKLLGHSVDYMAYPFGRQSSVSRRVMVEAEKIGYKCAFGTIQSLISDKSTKNLFYIPRIVKK